MRESSFKKSSDSLNNPPKPGLRKIKKAFVITAGKGMRFRSYSRIIPKSMFVIDSEPLIARNIRLLDAAFDLDKLYVLISKKNAVIRECVSKMTALKCKLEFIEIAQENVSKNLLAGYAALVPYLEPSEVFISVLGDAYYEGIDHGVFAEFVKRCPVFAACCAVKKYLFPDEYFKNYSVDLQDDSLVKEGRVKPRKITSAYFGLGLIAGKRELAELAKKN